LGRVLKDGVNTNEQVEISREKEDFNPLIMKSGRARGGGDPFPQIGQLGQ